MAGVACLVFGDDDRRISESAFMIPARDGSHHAEIIAIQVGLAIAYEMVDVLDDKFIVMYSDSSSAVGSVIKGRMPNETGSSTIVSLSRAISIANEIRRNVSLSILHAKASEDKLMAMADKVSKSMWRTSHASRY